MERNSNLEEEREEKLDYILSKSGLRLDLVGVYYLKQTILVSLEDKNKYYKSIYKVLIPETVKRLGLNILPRSFTTAIENALLSAKNKDIREMSVKKALFYFAYKV